MGSNTEPEPSSETFKKLGLTRANDWNEYYISGLTTSDKLTEAQAFAMAKAVERICTSERHAEAKLIHTMIMTPQANGDSLVEIVADRVDELQTLMEETPSE